MERYIVTNLERALKILELIATKKEGSTITEIANSLGFPKNSVFRIMRTLEANGYLTEKERRYHFSPKLISLGYAGIESTNLVSAALDAMHALRDEINETVFIGCLSEYQKVVILEELPSYQYVKFTIEVGHMVPIHASAPGKAILSFMPEKEQEDMLNHIRFRRYNDRTIPSKRAFFFQAEDGIRDSVASRGLGDVYKRQRISHRLPMDLRSGLSSVQDGSGRSGWYCKSPIHGGLQKFRIRARTEEGAQWRIS